MKRRMFDKFEVRWEQPLQEQLSAVSTQLFAVHFLWWVQSGTIVWPLKSWGTARTFLFHSENSYVRKNIVLLIIIYYFTCSLHFLILCVWSINGNSADNLWLPSTTSWLVARVNKIIFFFSKSCRWVTFAKVGFIILNTASYFKQCLFCVSAQHIPLFLSMMLNWSIEGNITPYVYFKVFVITCH